YKRNVTMRGNSAYDHSQSPRSKAQRLRMRRRQIVTLLVGVIIAVVVLLWLVGQFMVNVVVTSSSAPEGAPADRAKYEQAIQAYLNDNPVERLRFLVNQAAL